MQPIRHLEKWLQHNTNNKQYFYSFNNLRSLFPELSNPAYKTLLSRAVKSDILERICRGVYAFKHIETHDGLLLFHIAGILRANAFNYISLETVLSDTGFISQIPINWITLMSSGRSNVISCGDYGNIEFVHTRRQPSQLKGQLFYDKRCGLWRATPALALDDMKRTRRDCSLIDWDGLDESI